MASFGGAIGNANFQQPSSPDQTSAPQMPDQDPMQAAQAAQQGQQQQPGAISQKVAGSLAAALAKRKKAAGPTMRAPATLASAVSRARRAHQGGDRYGS